MSVSSEIYQGSRPRLERRKGYGMGGAFGSIRSFPDPLPPQLQGSIPNGTPVYHEVMARELEIRAQEAAQGFADALASGDRALGLEFCRLALDCVQSLEQLRAQDGPAQLTGSWLLVREALGDTRGTADLSASPGSEQPAT